MRTIKAIKASRILIGTVLAGTVLASGAANASAYAVSANSITSFTIAFDSTRAKLSPYTATNDTAELSGSETGYGAVKDAFGACVSCGYSNSFVPHGGGSAYAYGDTLISNTSVLAGTGAASAIGEASVLALEESPGHGYGNNSMTGTLKVTAPVSVAFHFNATPYLLATVSAAGDSATAYSAMNISLVQGSATLFSWAPDGLNLSLSPLEGTATYAPGSGYFSAMTGALAAGTYTLHISMTNDAFASAVPSVPNDVSAVPVPAAAWLLGSGLLGLVGVARRKDAA